MKSWSLKIQSWSLRRWATLGSGLALAIFALVEAASYRSIQTLDHTVDELIQISRLLTKLDDVMTEVTEAETAKRGYLLAGEERYLGRYHDAITTIEADLDTLRVLVASEEERQQHRFAELDTLVAAKFAEVRDLIEIRRRAGFTAAVASFQEGQAKALMDQIRRVHREMASDEVAEQEAWEAETRARTTATFEVMGLGTLLGLIVVAIAAVQIRRDALRGDESARVLEAARAELEVRVSERTADLEQANSALQAQIVERERVQSSLTDTLAQLEKSNADMEIVLNGLQLGTAIVDAAGRVTFLSQAAERLLGRPLAELRGRSWQEAFPLARAEREALEATCASSGPARARVPIHLAGPYGRRYWLSVDVQDDPRDVHGKIFFLYDVTEVSDLRRQLGDQGRHGELIGKSPPVQRLFHLVDELAKVDSTVLIEGQTGTGKELVARAIHAASPRGERAFVAVNSAGLTDSLLASQLFGHKRGAFTGAVADQGGLFEAAEGGALFLDEIGDMPANVQVALLRALQEREITRLGDAKPRRINVRVLAATQHDLAREVEAGRFRADLLYRLRVARIALPPLRERREDIPLLVETFLAQCRAATGKSVHDVSADAMRLLLDHPWPGNVRELKSAIEFGVICATGAIIRPEDLPPEVVEEAWPRAARDDGLGAPLDDDPASERERIARALEKASGNRSKAAQLLGVSRATLYRRLAALAIPLS